METTLSSSSLACSRSSLEMTSITSAASTIALHSAAEPRAIMPARKLPDDGQRDYEEFDGATVDVQALMSEHETPP